MDEPAAYHALPEPADDWPALAGEAKALAAGQAWASSFFSRSRTSTFAGSTPRSAAR
jgi:hypothetical protein